MFFYLFCCIIYSFQFNIINCSYTEDFENTNLYDSTFVFIENTVTKTFEDAKTFCQSNYPSGNLISIDSQSQNEEVQQIVENAGYTAPYYWIGGERKSSFDCSSCGAGQCVDHVAWRWVDGQAFSYYNWENNECGSLIEPSHCTQECIVVYSDCTSATWRDMPCTNTYRGYVCEYTTPNSPNPTKTPTKSPTNYPTTIPTIHPTMNPTLNPSINPTLFPSKYPTNDPSLHPTNYPTKNPTFNPSINPSKFPTNTPNTDPTIHPTNDPTNHPTIQPTFNPTANPTVNPSVNPSTNPTLDPTINPSNIPTIYPTFNPSKIPTIVPSIQPSISPILSETTLSPSISNSSKNNSSIGIDLTSLILGLVGTIIVMCCLIICLFCYKTKSKSRDNQNDMKHEIQLQEKVLSTSVLETEPDIQSHIQLDSQIKEENEEGKKENVLWIGTQGMDKYNGKEKETKKKLKRISTKELLMDDENNNEELYQIASKPQETTKGDIKNNNINEQENYYNHNEDDNNDNNDNNDNDDDDVLISQEYATTIGNTITRGYNSNTIKNNNNNNEGEQIILGDPNNWTLNECLLWLNNIVQLPQYNDIFNQNEINGQILHMLNEERLTKMGINIMGHRLKIIKCINNLNQNKLN